MLNDSLFLYENSVIFYNDSLFFEASQPEITTNINKQLSENKIQDSNSSEKEYDYRMYKKDKELILEKTEKIKTNEKIFNSYDKKIKIRKWTQEETQKLIKLSEEGKTKREISEILNRSFDYIRSKLLALEKKNKEYKTNTL